MVNQCQNQLNVKTSEKELRDSVNEEVRENLNFSCKKTKLTTDAITECINNIGKRPIFQLQLDNVSLALSSFFNCNVLYLGKLGDIVRVVDGRSSDTVEQVMSVWISSVVEDLPSVIQGRIPTNLQWCWKHFFQWDRIWCSGSCPSEDSLLLSYHNTHTLSQIQFNNCSYSCNSPLSTTWTSHGKKIRFYVSSRWRARFQPITFSKCFILFQAIQKIKCRYPWDHDLCSQVFRIQPCRAFMVSNRLSGVVFPHFVMMIRQHLPYKSV